MEQEVTNNDAIKNMNALFIAARNDCKNPKFDKENTYYHSKYASLASTMKAISSACRAHNISYVQSIEENVNGGGLCLQSSIVTETGERKLSCFPLPKLSASTDSKNNGKNNINQEFAKNLTYYRRQLAQTDWCIAAEEDTDANSLEQHEKSFEDVFDIYEKTLTAWTLLTGEPFESVSEKTYREDRYLDVGYYSGIVKEYQSKIVDFILSDQTNESTNELQPDESQSDLSNTQTFNAQTL